MPRPVRPPFALLFLLSLPIPLRSQEAPPPVADTLHSVVSSEGVEAAVATYKQLREARGDDFDFGFPQLNNLANRLLGEGETDAALRMLELNREFHPDMVRAHFAYANTLSRLRENDRAIDAYRRGLEVLAAQEDIPDNVRSYYQRAGELGIRIAENLNRADDPELTYIADVGGGPAAQWDAEMVLTYQASRPGLAVDYRSNDYYNAPVPFFVSERLRGGEHPDVASGFVKGVHREYLGVLAELSALWAREGWDEAFPPSLKRAVSYDGVPYFVPITFQWNPIWYRTDVFARLGLTPPATWEELLALSDSLHAAGYVPFTQSGRPWPPPVARWFSTLTLRLHGPDFYESLVSGEVAWTDARVREVFDHWRQLFEHHALDTARANNSWQNAVADLANGTAAMWNIGEWLFEFGPLQAEMENIDFFPMPPIRPGVPKAEILHLYGAYMFADAEDREVAEAFLAHLGSDELQRDNHATLKYRTPARLDVYDQLSDLQKRQYDYIKSVDHLVPLFEFNTRPEMAQAALQGFLQFWENPQSADAVLTELERVRREVYAETE